MPTLMLTKREKAALERALIMQRSGKVIQRFISAGWKNIDAVVAVVQQEYPKVERYALLRFWNNRDLNLDLLEKMEVVLENLKAE
jgi:hypothetical protein